MFDSFPLFHYELDFQKQKEDKVQGLFLKKFFVWQVSRQTED
jgi:hypothetical protein